MAMERYKGTDLQLVGVIDPATGQAVGASPTEAFASGRLADNKPVVIELIGARIPSVITISGAAGAVRRIELSTDGGTDNGWFTPQYDASTNTMTNVQVAANATHARLTGGAGDAWSVR